MRKIQSFPPNFPLRKFSANGQFPRISGRITQKSKLSVYGKCTQQEIR